jgi:hypothetical protein
VHRHVPVALQVLDGLLARTCSEVISDCSVEISLISDFQLGDFRLKVAGCFEFWVWRSAFRYQT